MTNLKCFVCRNKINGKYLQANVDSELKPTASGAVICSTGCAEKYQKELEYGGNAIQHWSRITGYYQNISGWNKGKVAELQDRKRFDI